MAVMALSLFYALNATAQPVRDSDEFDQMSAEEMAEKQTKKMHELLNLTDEQKEKVRKINLKYAKKFKKRRESGAKNSEEMREHMMKLSNEKDEKLKKVLREDQYTRLVKERKKALHEERRRREGKSY